MNQDPKKILWQNVQSLMESKWGEVNLTKLSREAGFGPATSARIKECKTSIGLDVLISLANVFNVRPWQLLVPVAQEGGFEKVIEAWNMESGIGRRMLLGAAAGALSDEEEDARIPHKVPGRLSHSR